MNLKLISLSALALAALWSTESSAAEYTVNGWKIRVSVASDSPAVMLGEPMWLSFKVENLSNEDLQLIVSGSDTRGDFGFGDTFQVRVVDEAGVVILPPKKAGSGGNGRVGPQSLPSQSNYTFRLFLPDWVQWERPGTYTIACAKQLRLLKPEADRSWNNTTNLSVAAETKVVVTAYDAVRMGELIEALGSELLASQSSGGDEPRKSLAHIHDDRALPFWLKRLEHKDYSAKFGALNALGGYPAQAAVEALKQAMESKGADLPNCCTTAEGSDSLARNLRVLAAHSLAKNKNPDARRFLLDHRRSPDNELRLTVVHMLGREKTEESAALLKEMTSDTNTLVRGEAERYLKDRTDK